MVEENKRDVKIASQKLKIEPFRISGKTSIKDAPIFDIDNEIEEKKRRLRRIVVLKKTIGKQEIEDGGKDMAKVEEDNRESKDNDVVELEATNDFSSGKEGDAISEGTLGERQVKQEGKRRHHKKHKKHQKKKKRRKDKSQQDTHGKITKLRFAHFMR